MGGLDRDCKLGVLEKVPVNDPVKWCHRMLITPKPNGEPRRVVDFTALNKYAPRQTHHTETPWALVSSIPSNKVKSTLDCWHGYHSVPLAPADRHLTTFITPKASNRNPTARKYFTCDHSNKNSFKHCKISYKFIKFFSYLGIQGNNR